MGRYEGEGQKARGPWAVRNGRGGKLGVNGLRQVAGGEGGMAKGLCLNVLNL